MNTKIKFNELGLILFKRRREDTAFDRVLLIKYYRAFIRVRCRECAEWQETVWDYDKAVEYALKEPELKPLLDEIGVGKDHKFIGTRVAHCPKHMNLMRNPFEIIDIDELRTETMKHMTSIERRGELRRLKEPL